jgi:hypothetical protein
MEKRPYESPEAEIILFAGDALAGASSDITGDDKWTERY